MIASLALAEREEERALLVPAPELLPPAKGEEDTAAYPQADSRAKLRITLERYAVNHQAALQAALEEAPESVKPALLKAIAISKAGYEKALKALD